MIGFNALVLSHTRVRYGHTVYLLFNKLFKKFKKTIYEKSSETICMKIYYLFYFFYCITKKCVCTV